MCIILYWKKGREAQQYNKKICGPQFSIIALWILSFASNTQKLFYTRVNFFLFFLLQYFPISLYLCIESIHIMYFNSIVSEWNERCTFEPKLHTMHNHPSLIHSFFFLSLSIYNFTCSLIHSGNSLSFCFYFFFSIFFFCCSVLPLAVVIVYVSNSFFWCNAYISL